MMREQSLNYHSFLLRIWEQDGEWRATLQEVSSGECKHYASLFELYVKLLELTNDKQHENCH
jgi:hypothetical protein